MKYTEARLEAAILELLVKEGYQHIVGDNILRQREEVLLKDDLISYLQNRYASDNITLDEINSIIRSLEQFSANDLYNSNKEIIRKIADGFNLKREDHTQKDLYIQLIDYNENSTLNICKVVNQLEIVGYEKRIPDAILYINGLPLVVFEFKSAIREDATIYDAFLQLTNRYQYDIPELFKYNAFCVISDGVNSKVGSLFAPYEFFYAWRKVTGHEKAEYDGVKSLYSLIQGMFNFNRLKDIIRNFIYFPDSSTSNEKIVCRYPQYYAARKLYNNICIETKPNGSGKGGTYFGATGCGKSYTMLFLARLLMKSIDFKSPTIVMITDRTDLDDQLSKLFMKAKIYIGDNNIISVDSRDNLKTFLTSTDSGGVFLTTIQKFTESFSLLSERTNIICISDEAHRSQLNLDKTIKITDSGVQQTFGFAKYLHDSLPNATYVGFTGTPVDATLDVFGKIVDAYTMNEAVKDEITVPIVYEGRAAKVLLNSDKLHEIEEYYKQCAEDGTSDYQIEASKKANIKLDSILSDPDRIKDLALDFVTHYEKRVTEGASLIGKTIFVCSSRSNAYNLYQELMTLRPEWNEIKICDENITVTSAELKKIKPIERLKVIMTANKDDSRELKILAGNKNDRKELDRQFKNPKSNFKIAIVVDMWLTGFDVPELDTIYIDKPIQRHNLIQTISRVNRKIKDKNKGLVVDYIGIKRQMNQALAQYSKEDITNIEDIEQSIIVVKDHLELLDKIFCKFDSSSYFQGSPLEQLACLNLAAEFIQITAENEKRFMYLAKRLKLAYDICCGSDVLTEKERDLIHFYMAIRSIVFKLTKGNAPDIAQMNHRVNNMIKDALQSNGVEEIFKLGDNQSKQVNIFDDEYLQKIARIKLPNTKIKLLQQLLKKAIKDFKKINKIKGVDFSEKFQILVNKYNERKEQDILVSNVLEDFTDEIIDLFHALKLEKESFGNLGIDIEEKAFYDILKALAQKYDFSYPEEKLLILAKEVKNTVDDKAKFTDWNEREDIKAELKVSLILLLAKYKYPPVNRDEVYKEIFEQAENFKKYQKKN